MKLHRFLGWLFLLTAALTVLVMLWAISRGQYGYLLIHSPMIVFQVLMADFNFRRAPR